jgi:hypothetical protein
MPGVSSLVDKFVLGVDIEGYSSRTTREQQQVQRSLDEILTGAARAVGLDRSQWERQPGGDGELAVLPDSTDLVTMVRPFVTQLGILLADHNQDHKSALRIRLRLAMHVDALTTGTLGTAGPALVVLSRFLDSSPLKSALQETAADLVLLISEPVYRKAVLAEMGGLRPAQFTRLTIDIPAKAFRDAGYLYVPASLHHQGTAAPTSGDGPPGDRHNRETSIDDLAGRVTDLLMPALPYLLGFEVLEDGEHLEGIAWTTAMRLWGVLQEVDAFGRVPEARQKNPDPAVLRGRLADALSQNSSLADRVSAAITGQRMGHSAAQVQVAGHYFHHGDNISGTSIKHYNG